jgi:hypothetical protein
MAPVPGESEVSGMAGQDAGRGGVALALNKAAALGAPFPAHLVPDTPGNRELFAQIMSEIASMPGGVGPDVPYDHADDPDPGNLT